MIRIVMLCAAMLLVSCGGKQLSRPEAARQLKEHLAKDSAIDVVISNVPNNLIWGVRCIANIYGQVICPDEPGDINVIQLRKLGLLEFTQRADLKEPYRDAFNTGKVFFSVSATNEGGKYLEQPITPGTLRARTKTIEDLEVTGITAPADAGGRKMALVSYNVRFKLTPWGKWAERSNTEVLERQGQAQFVLFDDGWRLQ